MRQRILTGLSTIVALLLFVISTIPVSTLKVENNVDLRSVVTHVQQLQSPGNSKLDFRIVFSNTVTSLQAAADLNTIFTQQKKSSETEKSQFTISVRLPYLLPTSFLLEVGTIFANLSPTEYTTVYQSHIISPDTPPPMVSTC